MIYIIIPIHNRKRYTLNCLASLSTQTFSDFKTVVVDDGSTDGSSEEISSLYPDVILLKGDGNLWWTGATNLGVRYALDHSADYVLALNNDTLPPPDFLSSMMNWANNLPNALIGALGIDVTTGKPIYTGEIINWKTGKYQPLRVSDREDELTGIHEVTHFPGRGLLIPVEVFSTIGLYDQEHFPHYAADFDFTHRAIRAGFPIYCNYDAKLGIYPEASSGQVLRREKNFGNYWSHLFSIKGVGNLKVFSIYAIRNCPPKYLPFFLITGVIRRIVGYWLH